MICITNTALTCANTAHGLWRKRILHATLIHNLHVDNTEKQGYLVRYPQLYAHPVNHGQEARDADLHLCGRRHVPTSNHEPRGCPAGARRLLQDTRADPPMIMPPRGARILLAMMQEETGEPPVM